VAASPSPHDGLSRGTLVRGDALAPSLATDTRSAAGPPRRRRCRPKGRRDRRL